MSVKQSKPTAGWHLDHSYARLPEIFFARIKPTPVRAPKLILLNHPLATSLGLNAKTLKDAEVFSGNRLPEGALPIAQAYAGHQFAYFTMLGDGRAILLGEQLTPGGKLFDIQLKGSGLTPFSRKGDGRAALGPMLREYLISEAMHALGIPSSRSLAVVSTGETVLRETAQPGAILTRVATSHLRVGTFQYVAGLGSTENLILLADYTLKRHFPEVANEENRYLVLLTEVIRRQAELVARWQQVGFIHGVMNTDNMTISGETIDYGPCAFIDSYDPATVFSSIDQKGRYAYGNQPQIAGWNLARFAETLLPLLHPEPEQAITMAQGALAEFSGRYQASLLAGMRKKLGLFSKESEDAALVDELLILMHQHRADYTNTFCALESVVLPDTLLFRSPGFILWHELWQARLTRQNKAKNQVLRLMQNNNPAVIPRNHQVEIALSAAVEQKDYRAFHKLLTVLAKPYARFQTQAEYQTPPPPATRPYQTFCGT